MCFVRNLKGRFYCTEMSEYRFSEYIRGEVSSFRLKLVDGNIFDKDVVYCYQNR